MFNNRINFATTVSTNTTNFNEVNEELTRLKYVIGFLLAKLPPDNRDEFIKDLERIGLVDEAKVFSAFK
jgi:hypothetical protein